MDLSALSDFNLVAGHGGFGRAARASGRPKATLSRRVSELEASLGTRLIERGGHSLRLTEAGALLHARTGPLLGEIAEVGASVGGGLDKPRGRLRLSAPLLLSDTQLGRVAATFIRAYPEVDLEIRSEDRFVDPVDEDFDVVIRVNPKPDERLVGRCVLRDEQWLVAEPGAVLPEPLNGSDVVDLPSVVRSLPRPGETWCVHGGRDRRSYRPVPVLRLSSLPTVRDAVVAGAGAALLPRSLVGSDVAAGRLTCWGWLEGPPTELWALYTSRRLVSPKVKAFVAHLADALAGPGGAVPS
ncbi:LysR family transcriptional regulator [Methylobacterium sp. J-067]|uniref:LysR family transcriptional regulator n=1 Tax=Methylobacterium sp. J-067 TaxID=2836648 RepID=UPI001FBB4223|nr:LysR family transcriptional regulator [Methylobacterium sp. J-067]MCJ2023157.1 LysR family transcriptional regulator [Methylobacterium sp. J-067]